MELVEIVALQFVAGVEPHVVPEAALDPHFADRVFRLGFEYGYLSQWLGGYGKQPDAVMQELSRPVAAHRRRLDELAA